MTWVEECDFSRVDLKLLVPTVLKACAAALAEFPELNARLEGDEIVYLDRYDLGVAVQTDRASSFPSCAAATTRSLEELRADVERLADAARAGTLEAGGAPRLDVHDHERREARRAASRRRS